MNIKPNLVSVIGNQPKIIPHFIDHYKEIVNDFYFIVHKTEKFDDIIHQLNLYSITPYRIIDIKKNDWGKITSVMNDVKRIKPNEWWIIADIDELQVYPMSVDEIIKKSNELGYSVIYGVMIDRVTSDGSFDEITDDCIWETFPMAGQIRNKLSGACSSKVAIIKGGIDVGTGQHVPKFDGKEFSGFNHPQIFPVDELMIQIHHFKWNSGVIDRTRDLLEYHQNHITYDEDKKLYSKIKKGIDVSNTDFNLSKSTKDFYSYKNWHQIKHNIIEQMM